MRRRNQKNSAPLAPLFVAAGGGKIVLVRGDYKPADILSGKDGVMYVVLGEAPTGCKTYAAEYVVNELTRVGNDTGIMCRIMRENCWMASREDIARVRNCRPAIIRFRVVGKLWGSEYNDLYVVVGGLEDEPWTIYLYVDKRRHEPLEIGAWYVGYGWFAWCRGGAIRFRLVSALKIGRWDEPCAVNELKDPEISVV